MRKTAKMLVMFILLSFAACDDTDTGQHVRITVHGSSDNVSIEFKGGTLYSASLSGGLEEEVFENISLPYVVERTIPRLGPCPDYTILSVIVSGINSGMHGTIYFDIEHDGRSVQVNWENNEIEIENDVEVLSGRMLAGENGDIGVMYGQFRKECEEE